MDESSLDLIGNEGGKNIIKNSMLKNVFFTYSEYKRLLN